MARKYLEWVQVSKLRKIIKDGRTKVTKSRNGNTCGGIALDGETIKPYLKKLEDLEAKQTLFGELDNLGTDVLPAHGVCHAFSCVFESDGNSDSGYKLHQFRCGFDRSAGTGLLPR